MKAIIKLLIAAAIVHATWKAGSAYMKFYEFKDEVTQIAQFGVNQSNETLRLNVIDAAKRHEIPLDPAAVSVERRQAHIFIDANYIERIELLPRYFYPWEARMHVDVLTLVLREAK